MHGKAALVCVGVVGNKTETVVVREKEQQYDSSALFLSCQLHCASAVTQGNFGLLLRISSKTAEEDGRLGVYKIKNGQITILILLSCSREMFSTQAERVVLGAFRVNGTQYSHRPHMGIVHAYAQKHLQKQILFAGCLSKHLRTLHFTHSARGCFRTFMIVVHATLPDVKKHIM